MRQAGLALTWLKAPALRAEHPGANAEGAMVEQDGGQAGLRSFEPAINAIAQWVRLCRIALGARDELTVASPEEVARIARELGVRPPELAQAVARWPAGAELLRTMMLALGLDPEAPALKDHAALGELQRLCAGCGHKAECAQDLAAGTALESFYGYCPNARTLDSIYVETTFNRL
jgi:hypothetical protein